ncbi:hypothetical protein SAMN05660236_5274 [Ohtaekwangia koreensis]|uniref:Uncharacterized protein n=2 Tax=Ohtaekwangia koreensis TaxID=688867 RepID=A0A1T5MFZ9_9BACT|nr:hypothetical protein SAMN05660236_5274 [Ohtaekwangia koreensis]
MNSLGNKTKFESSDQKFFQRARSLQMMQLVWWPFCFFIIVAFVYSLMFHEGQHSRRLMGKVLEGITHMSSGTVALIIVAGILVTVVVVLLIRGHYKNRKIIVELNFNDTTNELTVRSKTVDEKQNIDSIKYSEIRFSPDRLSDGMTTAMYDVITLLKNDGYLIGHIFSKHFTWNQEDFDAIKVKVSRIVGETDKERNRQHNRQQ